MPKMRNRKRSNYRANKKGETIQCGACATKINLKDKNGRVGKGTKQVQDAIASLGKTVKKIGGSLKVK
jgi:hypothetical protein